MFESLVLDGSTILGGSLVVLVLAFLRFGDAFVDWLLLYRSTPVDAVESSIRDQD